MLRPLRRSDVDRYADLVDRHFPEEARLLLADRSGFRAVVARAFRWDAVLLLGLLRLARRPLLDLHALEADGRLAGSTFVFYMPPSAYVTNVVVDTPYRGRGYAKLLMARAEAAAHRRGCLHTVLDVIDTNAPAIALYEALGYRPVRDVDWMYRDVGPDQPPLPAEPSGDRARAIRPFARADAARLLPLARAAQNAEERRIRPFRPGAFRVPPPIVAVLGGATEAFVHDAGSGADGFLRASTSAAMASGHLSVPLFGPALSDAEALDLLDRGMSWFSEHPVRRIICEVPRDDAGRVRLLAARGFQRGLGVHTLAKPLTG